MKLHQQQDINDSLNNQSGIIGDSSFSVNEKKPYKFQESKEKITKKIKPKRKTTKKNSVDLDATKDFIEVIDDVEIPTPSRKGVQKDNNRKNNKITSDTFKSPPQPLKKNYNSKHIGFPMSSSSPLSSQSSISSHKIHNSADVSLNNDSIIISSSSNVSRTSIVSSDRTSTSSKRQSSGISSEQGTSSDNDGGTKRKSNITPDEGLPSPKSISSHKTYKSADVSLDNDLAIINSSSNVSRASIVSSNRTSSKRQSSGISSEQGTSSNDAGGTKRKSNITPDDGPSSPKSKIKRSKSPDENIDPATQKCSLKAPKKSSMGKKFKRPVEGSRNSRDKSGSTIEIDIENESSRESIETVSRKSK